MGNVAINMRKYILSLAHLRILVIIDYVSYLA